MLYHSHQKKVPEGGRIDADQERTAGLHGGNHLDVYQKQLESNFGCHVGHGVKRVSGTKKEK